MITTNKILQSKPKSKPYRIYDKDGLYMYIYPDGMKDFVLLFKNEKHLIGTYGDIYVLEARELSKKKKQALIKNELVQKEIVKMKKEFKPREDKKNDDSCK